MHVTRRTPRQPDIAKPTHKHLWDESHNWWNSFLTGMADLTLFAHPAERIPFPHDSEAGALKGDWIMIGQDMGRVLERQQHAPTKEEA